MRPLVFFLLVVVGSAQPPSGAARPAEAKEPSEPGIPVRSELVKAKCSGCHRADAKGNLTRISWERTTPEGWQQIIKRMVRLNGLVLQPEEAREIVKTLSETHGLAPEEAKPVAWYWEKRYIDGETHPTVAIGDACASCHPMAQALSWRRSREEWDLLVDMHRGYFPVVENTSFRRPSYPAQGGGGGGAAAGPTPGQSANPAAIGTRRGLEQMLGAVDYLAKGNPLHTPEWAAWQGSRGEARFAGRWLVTADLAAKGRFIGEMVIAGGAGGEFTSKTTLTSLNTGEKIAREGKAVVYTGYAWRGRSNVADKTFAGKEEREVMSFSADQLSAEGRWFWGGYSEFGYDVKLVRAGDGPVLLTTSQVGLPIGSKGTELKIYGDSLPAGLQPAEINLGRGVTVTQIVAQTPSLLNVKVDVAADALPGKRPLAIRRATLPAAVPVYGAVDYIKIPRTSHARLGGTTHPKGFFQYEAIACSNGIDGKPNTADDIEIAPVAAKWSMEEFAARMGDDDKEFVGSLSAEGLFTPNVEGPNESRKFGTNNFGDVWVVATYEGGPKPVVAKSYLVVSIPLYVRWDHQPEAGR
jgi:quinohemoprotein amine dehydrogenase